MVVFPPSVWHAGAAMEDLDGEKLGYSRRRVFLYLDYATSVVDSLGQVLAEKEFGGIPDDYEVNIYEVNDLKAGFYLLSSPFLDGRVYETERLSRSASGTK